MPRLAATKAVETLIHVLWINAVLSRRSTSGSPTDTPVVYPIDWNCRASPGGFAAEPRRRKPGPDRLDH